MFGMIPGLAHAEFVRYGVMHRNTFLNSPALLNGDYSFRGRPELFFAGQITGVEGYMESASSGLLAGINLARRWREGPPWCCRKPPCWGLWPGMSPGIRARTFSRWGPISGCCRPCRREFGTSGSGTWLWPGGGFPIWRPTAGKWASPYKKALRARKWRRAYENHRRRLWRGQRPPGDSAGLCSGPAGVGSGHPSHRGQGPSGGLRQGAGGFPRSWEGWKFFPAASC